MTSPIVTIDSRTTLDMDDGIWVEKAQDHWNILVAIADVAPAVGLRTKIDDRAKNLVTTRYFPTSTLSMLPRYSTEQDLSLWPQKPRQVIAIEIQLSRGLDLIECRPYATTLTSHAKLAYDDIPAILSDVSSPWNQMLCAAVDLSHALLEKRRSLGAMAIYDLNNGWATTEEGHIRQLASHELTVGYIVIQELMILANSLLAEYAVKREIPVLFRNHTANNAAPDRGELVRQLNAAFHTPIVNLDAFRQRTHMLLSKATYDASLLGHYGLNLPAYMHFTSPIRRYPDLVNHRQIRASLMNEPSPYTREQLDEIGKHCTTVLQELRDSKSDHMRQKAEDRAHRSLDRTRFRSLSDKELERVTKVAARSEAGSVEALGGEFQHRMDDDRFPLICAAVAFVEGPDNEDWTRLRVQLLNYLAHKPELAVSVLNLALQMNPKDWPEPVYVETVLSLDPPQFQATASIRDKNGRGTGATKKAAKQQAVLHLLGVLVGLDLPQVPPDAVPAPVAPALNLDGKDPISALHEWAQAQRVAAPVYKFQMVGTLHVPTFTCHCECSGVGAEGKAASKQEAKRNAARALLQRLAS